MRQPESPLEGDSQVSTGQPGALGSKLRGSSTGTRYRNPGDWYSQYPSSTFGRHHPPRRSQVALRSSGVYSGGSAVLPQPTRIVTAKPRRTTRLHERVGITRTNRRATLPSLR